MVVESLDVLISESPLIVIGEVRQPAEIVNMARNVEDVSEPDPSIFGLGQVYEVAVEQYLKGDGPSTLKVIQSEGFTYSRDGGPLDQDFSDEEIAALKQQSLDRGEHVPMEPGDRYVFFVGEPVDSRFEAQYFNGVTGVPWRMAITEDGILRPESPSSTANQHIGTMTLEELISEIQRIDLGR